MNKREAELQINAILSQYEKENNTKVDYVRLVAMDITTIADAHPQHLCSVKIEEVPNAEHRWSLAQESK